MLNKFIKIVLIFIIIFLIGRTVWPAIKKNVLKNDPRLSTINLIVIKDVIQKKLDEWRWGGVEKFSALSLENLTEDEKKNGFLAYITGYCRPKIDDYENEIDFLCAVGLNCSCPNGIDETKKNYCGIKNKWTPCKNFNITKFSYCHQTASGSKPEEKDRTIAAPETLPFGTIICLENQEYIVKDRGKYIVGRRFDVWQDDCRRAGNIDYVQKVKIGKCR